MPTDPGSTPSWTAFWFAPVSPVSLHVVRAGAGLLFLVWLLSLAGHREELFGLRGWFDALAYKESAQAVAQDVGQESPRTSAPMPWSLLYLCGTDPVAFHAAYWASVAVLALFTLGVASRVTAVLTWLIVASFTANPTTYDTADQLLTMLAFYLMLGYVLLGQWGSPQGWRSCVLGSWKMSLLGGFRTLASANAETASRAANLAMRLCQVHLALFVFTSGLQKLQFAEWWSGVALWYPLHPPFESTAEELASITARAPQYLFMLGVAGYAVLAWQLLFPMFAWRKGLCRIALLGGAMAGWIGSASVHGAPLYGPVLFVASLCFVSPGEWQRLFGRLAPMRHRSSIGKQDAGIPLAAA